MKTNIAIFLALLIATACGKQASHDHDTMSSDSTSGNEALYDQVMGVHDEVMPKVNDIMELKRKLQEKIANTPNMVAEERGRLEKRIIGLDSAANAMMDWMHNFQPPADSLGQETVREYLETEMEKIQKVRDAMMEVIDKEKKSN